MQTSRSIWQLLLAYTVPCKLMQAQLTINSFLFQFHAKLQTKRPIWRWVLMYPIPCKQTGPFEYLGSNSMQTIGPLDEGPSECIDKEGKNCCKPTYVGYGCSLLCIGARSGVPWLMNAKSIASWLMNAHPLPMWIILLWFGVWNRKRVICTPKLTWKSFSYINECKNIHMH